MQLLNDKIVSYLDLSFIQIVTNFGTCSTNSRGTENHEKTLKNLTFILLPIIV